MKLFGIYMLCISVLSVALTVLDKRAARRRAMRVPEIVLLLFAALGGEIAMYITMRVIHHKTRHPKFMIGLPVIFVLHIMLLLYLVWRYVEAKG